MINLLNVINILLFFINKTIRSLIHYFKIKNEIKLLLLILL